MILRIDKISRLFFVSNEKYFSINFPFFFDNGAMKNTVYNKNDKNIDSKIISEIMGLFSGKNILEANDIVSFFDSLEDLYDEGNVWQIVIELLTFEEGYVRFDDDTEHASELHPQYHIDIYYREGNKIKLGLNNMISYSLFLDLLDSKNGCYYINKMSNTKQ